MTDIKTQPVRFIKINAVPGQECRYCDHLPTRILLFSDWSEIFVCEECLVKKADFNGYSKDPIWSSWNPLSNKKAPDFPIKYGKNSIL